ncbi:MAG: hypothetical protein AAF721_26940 [Myxococcota bacterium]
MALVNILELLHPNEQTDESVDVSESIADTWLARDTPYLPHRVNAANETIPYRLGELFPPADTALVCEGPRTIVAPASPGVPMFLGSLEGFVLRGGTYWAEAPVVLAEEAFRCRFEDLSLVKLLDVGFDLGLVGDVVFRDVECFQGFASPLGTGIRVGGGVGLRIAECKFQEIDEGVVLLGVSSELSSVTVRGTWFERITKPGVRAGAGVHGLSIVDSYFESNGGTRDGDVELNAHGGVGGASATIAGCTFGGVGSSRPARVVHGEHVSLVARDNLALLAIGATGIGIPFVAAGGGLEGVAMWLLRNRLNADHVKPSQHCETLHPDYAAACIELELHTLSRFMAGTTSLCGATCSSP